MIEILNDFTGESLIRYIMYRGAGETVVRMTLSHTPSPTLPQILAKAGITRLEIVSTPVDGQTVSNSFQWQGIDGTQIETAVESACEIWKGTVLALPSESTPTWYGELPPLEISSEPARKRSWLQRSLEARLRSAEFLRVVRPAAAAQLLRSDLAAAWKVLLESNAALDPHDTSDIDARSSTLNEISAASDELAAAIDTRGLKRPVMVLNNLSCYANEAVEVLIAPGEMPVTAVGPEGELQPVQIRESQKRGRYALFVAKNAPLHGYAVWDLGATLIPTESEDEVRVSPTHLENNSIRVEFDTATGLILRIFDKDSERELLGETFEVQRSGRRILKLDACANLIEICKPGEAGQKTALLNLEIVELVESGPVRGAIRFTRSLPGKNWSIVQEVRLTSGSARIDFATTVSWHDSDSMITAAFPVAINSSRYTAGASFGYAERPTFSNSAAETTDEQRCHWVDISEGDYGVALLNDAGCRYQVSGSTMRIVFDDAWDLVRQITYSLLPHGGDIREGEVMENYTAIKTTPYGYSITGNRPGHLPLQCSFFEVDNASVFIETIKWAEAVDAIIVRLYEAYNTRGEVLLTTTLPVKKAWLCDLLEANLAEIPIESGEILLPIHPFEIVTVKFAM